MKLENASAPVIVTYGRRIGFIPVVAMGLVAVMLSGCSLASIYNNVVGDPTLLQQSAPQLRARTAQAFAFDQMASITERCYPEPAYRMKQFQVRPTDPGDITVYLARRAGEPLPADIIHQVAVNGGAVDVTTTTLGGSERHQRFLLALQGQPAC